VGLPFSRNRGLDRHLYPFRYSDDEWTDLGALTIQQYPDPAGRLRDWARAFVGGNPTDTLALLKDLSAGLRVIVCDSEETADKDWIAGMNAACRCRERDGPAFVEVIFSHVRRVLFRGHETISGDALLTGWEFHQ
jgi:hypothetical protein